MVYKLVLYSKVGDVPPFSEHEYNRGEYCTPVLNLKSKKLDNFVARTPNGDVEVPSAPFADLYLVSFDETGAYINHHKVTKISSQKKDIVVSYDSEEAVNGTVSTNISNRCIAYERAEKAFCCIQM